MCGQKQHATRDFFGCAQTANWDLWNNTLIKHFFVNRPHHLGANISRADGIDGDARARTLLRKGFGKAQIACFGRRIVRLTRLTFLTIDRADVDHAAKFTVTHAAPNLMGHVEKSIEVGVDHFFPLAEGHFMKHAVASNSGVVDQDSNRAKISFD